MLGFLSDGGRRSDMIGFLSFGRESVRIGHGWLGLTRSG